MKKVCIVTGGSSGIGLAIVQKFIELDYDVFNLDLAPSDAGTFIQCDMADHQQVTDAVTKIAKHRAVDAFVANAGIYYSGNIENTSEQTLMKIFDINVKGTYSALQAILPFMRENRSGAIVLMGSDQCFVGKRNSFAYNLSKAAIGSMTKTTALDYAEYDIRVNAVCPGTIETPLYHKAIDNYCEKSGANKEEIHAEEAALQPLNRLGQPQEVAELVAFLASDKAKFVTGSLHAIDGGYTAQ